MFFSDIQKIENDLGISKFSSSNKQPNSYIDLQYELYSKYMRISSQQIAVKQLIIMNETSNLLVSMASINYFSQKDSSTLDSSTYDEQMDISNINDFSIIQRSSKRRITRKGNRSSNYSVLTKSGDIINSALRQIQNQCSQNTYLSIKNIVEQHKKTGIRLVQLQRKQKIVRRQQEKSQRLEQQNILLKQKLVQLQSRISQKQKQIQIYRAQASINSLKKSQISNQCLQIKLQSQGFLENTSKSKFKQIFLFLQEKQQTIRSRMKKVSQIQTSIEEKIEKSIVSKQNKENQSCLRCCSMIKKIKQSVVNYRKYLQEQAEQLESLYQKYKAGLIPQNDGSI